VLTALATLLTAATEHGASSKTPFYILGGLAAVYAVAIATIGITQPDFPRTQGAARTVFAISAVIVLAAMAAAVLTG
jgi:hypothetical protein